MCENIRKYCIFALCIVDGRCAKKRRQQIVRRHDCDSERIRTFIVRTGILNSIH